MELRDGQEGDRKETFENPFRESGKYYRTAEEVEAERRLQAQEKAKEKNAKWSYEKASDEVMKKRRAMISREMRRYSKVFLLLAGIGVILATFTSTALVIKDYAQIAGAAMGVMLGLSGLFAVLGIKGLTKSKQDDDKSLTDSDKILVQEYLSKHRAFLVLIVASVVVIGLMFGILWTGSFLINSVLILGAIVLPTFSGLKGRDAFILLHSKDVESGHRALGEMKERRVRRAGMMGKIGNGAMVAGGVIFMLMMILATSGSDKGSPYYASGVGIGGAMILSVLILPVLAIQLVWLVGLCMAIYVGQGKLVARMFLREGLAMVALVVCCILGFTV